MVQDYAKYVLYMIYEICPRYEQERNELIRGLQEMGCKEFTINNILNTKQGSGEIVRSVLKFIKHSGLRNRI